MTIIKNERIEFTAPKGTKNALSLVALNRESRGDVIIRLLMPFLDIESSLERDIKAPTNVLRTRITDEENKELINYLKSEKNSSLNISKLLNILLRKELKMRQLLMPNELKEITDAVSQLRKVGVKLNQYLSKVNKEEIADNMDKGFFDELLDKVNTVAVEVELFKVKHGYK